MTVATATKGPVCPLRLLRMMMLRTGGSDDAFLFRGFNGRLVRSSPKRTSPDDAFITYVQFTTCLSQWFGGVLGVSPSEFVSLYGSQSGRSGAASAASNAGIPLELRGQHGDWKSAAAQRCYMKKDATSILSVSLAAMGQPARRAPTPLGAPPLPIRNDYVPSTPHTNEAAYNVDGVPDGSFAWQS